jgi:hypothetical protein
MTDPGWYPDPEDETRARYWDGQAWTDRTGERQAIESAPEGPAAPPPADRPFWRNPLLGVAIAVLVAAAIGAFVVLGSSDAEAEVILEPTAAAGTDPFTDSVASEAVTELTSSGTELAGEPVAGISGGDGAIESLSGATPGLYGGTGEEAACDPEALVGYLEENPDKAAAFAGVFEIRPKQIGDYISELTPLLLREDTRVTNHGFTEGRANPFDAVLQAGSAVMVDERGVPRIRCACGNPLAEPAATDSAPEYSGEAWEGFDEQRILAVAPAEQELEGFEVVDVTTGELYEQGVGSGGLTEEDLLNLEMPPIFDVREGEFYPAARWVDGVHPDSDPGFEQRGASVVGITLEGERSEGQQVQATFGDLTGDGRDEGILARNAIGCGASCSYFGFDVVVFDSSGDLLDQVVLDERVSRPVGVIEELRVLDNGIELTGRAWAEDDARVDGPSIPVELRFEWNGSELEVVE